MYPTSSVFLIVYFDRCFILNLFECFLNGTNLLVMPSISYFKQVRRSVSSLFFNKLFQSKFGRHGLISLYLHWLKFLLHCILYVFPVFILCCNGSGYDHLNPKVLVFYYCQLIHLEKTTLNLTHSHIWLVPRHVE